MTQRFKIGDVVIQRARFCNETKWTGVVKDVLLQPDKTLRYLVDFGGEGDRIFFREMNGAGLTKKETK